MTYVNPLGEEKISKLLVKFSVPAIIGMLVNAMYNIVDRAFIGKHPDLGANGLAAITIGFPIMIILLAIGVLFGIGGATIFSMKLGEKKEDEAELALGNSFFMLVVTGILFTILGEIFLRPLLITFGASNTVLPYAIKYMRVIFLGSVFQIVSMGMNNFIRADGNPKIAMLTMFIGAGLNIILNPLFIYVFNMGMAGSALATVLSQLTSTIWVVQYFLGKRSKNKLKANYIRPDMPMVTRIISLGLPAFFIQLANSLLNAILNKSLITYGGDIAISGMGIINSIQTMLLMPIIGLNQGVQPIISFNFGAKKYDRSKAAAKLGIMVATIIVIVGFIITRIFPTQLIAFFNNDAELLKFGKHALLTWFICLPVIGFQIIAANFFQAIGRSKSAMFLSLTRQVILLIPALLIFPKFWGLDGLLYAAPFADFLSALLTGVWFSIALKNLKEDPIEAVNCELASDET